MTRAPVPGDVIDRLAGIAPDGPVARLRAARPGLTGASQSNHETLLEVSRPIGLSPRERGLAGFRAVVHSGDVAARTWYRDRLVAIAHPSGDRMSHDRLDHLVEAYPGGSGWLEPRDRAILRHTDLLTGYPAQATRSDIEALRDGGLDSREIVTLSQLVAFVAFQLRVVALFRALDEPFAAESGIDHTAIDLRTAADDEGADLPVFTREPVDWVPRIETVDEIEATPDQLAIVAEIAGARRTGRTYWATLAHDPDVLRSRHQLFPETLRDKSEEGGAAAADLELAAVAASRVTGCVYCASVHARAFVRYGGESQVIDAVLAGDPSGLDPRPAAIVGLAAGLARDPQTFRTADLAPARAAGLSELAILDIGYAAAMFAWANRLMLSLGDQAIPETD